MNFSGPPDTESPSRGQACIRGAQADLQATWANTDKDKPLTSAYPCGDVTAAWMSVTDGEESGRDSGPNSLFPTEGPGGPEPPTLSTSSVAPRARGRLPCLGASYPRDHTWEVQSRPPRREAGGAHLRLASCSVSFRSESWSACFLRTCVRASRTSTSLARKSHFCLARPPGCLWGSGPDPGAPATGLPPFSLQVPRPTQTQTSRAGPWIHAAYQSEATRTPGSRPSHRFPKAPDLPAGAQAIGVGYLLSRACIWVWFWGLGNWKEEGQAEPHSTAGTHRGRGAPPVGGDGGQLTSRASFSGARATRRRS